MTKAADKIRDKRHNAKVNDDELDLIKRCAAHAGCTQSEMTRYLYAEYAGNYGIPVRRDIPAPLTAEQMFSKLGIALHGAAEHHTVDASALEGNIDPDRFDESNTSTLDPLPPRRVP